MGLGKKIKIRDIKEHLDLKRQKISIPVISIKFNIQTPNSLVKEIPNEPQNV